MSPGQMTVASIMREAITISVHVTSKEALNAMVCQKTNALVVIDDDGVFVGFINTRIFIEQAIPEYVSNDEIAAKFANECVFRKSVEKIADVPIRDLLLKNVSTIGPDDNLLKAAIMATKNRQIRIPVLDKDNKPIGLLSQTEIKHLIASYLGVDKCFV